jgi:hypothetical protein
MSDPLKDLHKKTFIEGQEAEARQVKTQHFEERAALLLRAAQSATNIIDELEKLAADRHPKKVEVTQVIIAGVQQALEYVASGRVEPQEGQPAGVPFSSSTDSTKSLPGSVGSPPALTHQPTSEQPVKRGRGRPRKDPPPLPQ